MYIPPINWLPFLLFAGTILSGSHSDAIVQGGRYDGIVGVLGAITAIGALRESGFEPVKSIEAIMFSTEEATRFNLPCLGRCESVP